MRRDFSRRSDELEWMDADSDYETFRACLQDLAKVNVVTLGHVATLAFLERLRRDGRLDLGRPVEIVDVGSGYGDLLRAIGAWAARKDVEVRLTGVDLNPWAAKSAAGATPSGDTIRWATSNIFAYDQPCDVVVSSLFTHHLTDEQVVGFLRWMESATAVGWFVNDLHRHPAPFWCFALLARLMHWHPFVQHDGPISIARAFTAPGWRLLLEKAGIAGLAEVHWRFPFRIGVSRIKPR